MERGSTVALFGLVASLLMSGCGLDVSIMGGEQVVSGETASFQIKLTNVSPCPVADDTSGGGFAFLPLLPRSVIEQEGDLAELCGVLDNRALSADLAEGGTFPVEATRTALLSAASSAAPVTCSGPGVTCEPIPPEVMVPTGGVICSIAGDFAPGEMRTLECTAQATGAGRRFNLAASALNASGVCKEGPGEGEPCSIDADCGAGGDCGEGICVGGGGNEGNGCDAAGECPMGTCSDCAGMDGLGADCSETFVLSMAGAPLATPIGLIAVMGALGAIGAYRLRVRRRG